MNFIQIMAYNKICNLLLDGLRKIRGNWPAAKVNIIVCMYVLFIVAQYWLLLFSDIFSWFIHKLVRRFTFIDSIVSD